MEVRRARRGRRALSEAGTRAAAAPRTLVLGIGNVLMGDEGIGVEAARELARLPLGHGVEVLDGGTGGFHLLSAFDGVDRLVLIDAALDDRPVGTVRVVRPRFLKDYPRALSAHEIGLRDLIESATLLGRMPPTDLVTVSVAPPREVELGLSPAVSAALPEVIDAVRRLLGAPEDDVSEPSRRLA